MSLRVRKFNRTMSTLNGTIYIRQPMGDNLKLYTDLFHSRLGNQQFNHYPAKLPTAGFCEFVRNLHAAYGKHLVDIVNGPQPDECPIKAREVYILDKVFPSSTIPPVFPTGLWKMVITGRVDEEDKLRYQMVLHVHEKDFFG
ncbi:uncharacterized protein LOC128726835 [Anopheles nili]|uniref:uncharacterized protein LOC128726835 n=1 Tax=Anopheles nili TaxID=185578 RepID=UPI00237B82FA|nr:uncharacterized protein LOC128726835 [Anopheles nili]